MVERDRVFALEAERYPLTQNAVRTAAGEVFLQHDRRSAAHQPAPAQLALRGPLMLHGEAEAIDIEMHRALHVGDAQKWDDLHEVGADLDVCCHLVTSDHLRAQILRMPIRVTLWLNFFSVPWLPVSQPNPARCLRAPAIPLRN